MKSQSLRSSSKDSGKKQWLMKLIVYFHENLWKMFWMNTINDFLSKKWTLW